MNLDQYKGDGEDSRETSELVGCRKLYDKKTAERIGGSSCQSRMAMAVFHGWAGLRKS